MIKYLILLLLFVTACNRSSEEERLLRRAMQIHDQTLTIDSHTDTPLYLSRAGFEFGELHDARTHGSRVDLPRMEAGGLDAAFFAVFVGQGVSDEEGFERAFMRAETIYDSVIATIERYPQLELATQWNDAERLKSQGRRAIYIGVENGYPIGYDLDRVKHFFDRGARYITLSHTRNNHICDSSTDTTLHGGLTSFGKELVREMNRIGMMVDVSHICDSSFFDVLAITEAPVIASHSSARAVCDHPRNLSDTMLKALAKNGGVIQVCLLSSYVKVMPPNPERDSVMTEIRSKYRNFVDLSDEEMEQARAAWRAMNINYPPNLATVSDFVDHIDHIVEVAGIDHVGIGSDFDGGGGLSDCYDAGELPNITIELVKRGYSEEDIRKIWGENLLRVMREVEEAAARIQIAKI